MSWPTVDLGNAVEILSGFAWKSAGFTDNQSGVPIIRIQNVAEKNSPADFVYWGDDYNEKYLIDEGDVLLSLSGNIKLGYWNSNRALLNQRIVKVTPLQIIDKGYLYYFLSGAVNDIAALGKKAVISNVSVTDLKKIKIPLPPLSVQKQIAAVLEKADTLRSQCQQMEQALNSLAQSVFLDMFGDPLKNENGYPKKKLIELVKDKDDIKCGPFGTQLKKSEFVDTGVPLWGIKHVNSGFTIHTHEYVTIEKAKYLDSYSLNSGDIVMTRKGTVGNCHLYPSQLPSGIMHSDLLKITVDNSKIIPEFLVRQFRISKDIERQLLLISQGAIMAGINVGKLKSLEVAVPPIAEQIEFVRIIDTISSQLALNANQSEELNDNFNSIMQRAFNGELALKDVA